MYVNMRGCSGAGKSYAGFRLLEEYGPGEEIFSTEYFPNKKTGKPRKKPKRIAHVLPGGLCLAGRYVMGASTLAGKKKGYSGGLDGWHPMDELTRLLDDLFDEYPHGYFESLMVSGTFQRWLDFSERHGGPDNFTFATLDTPLDTCLARVQDRNGGKPVKEDQIEKHRRQVLRCASKFRDAGANSLMIDHNYSYEQVVAILKAGGWDPR